MNHDVRGYPTGWTVKPVAGVIPVKMHALTHTEDADLFCCGQQSCADVPLQYIDGVPTCPRCGHAYGEPLAAAVVRLTREVAELRAAYDALASQGGEHAGDGVDADGDDTPPASDALTPPALGPTTCAWRGDGCTGEAQYMIVTGGGCRAEVCGRCAMSFNPDCRVALPGAAPAPQDPPATLTPREALVLRAILDGRHTPVLRAHDLADAMPMPVANVRVLLAGLASRGLVCVPDPGNRAEVIVGLYLTDAGRRALGA